MKNIKNNLKFLSWIAASLTFIFVSYKVLQISNPELSIVKSASQIFAYSIVNNGSTKLTIGQILLSLFLMVIGIISSFFIKDRLMSPILDKSHLSLGTQESIKNLTHYFLIFTAFVFAFQVADISLTIFAFLGGAVAIGIGFGSQNILNNFISGIIIQTEKPMNVGDIIEIEDVRGVVVAIGARSTKLISASNTHIILPNSYFLDKRFINWTLYDNTVRSYIKVNYNFESRPDDVVMNILEMIKELDFVEKNPEPKVLVEAFSENGMQYGVFVWMRVNSTLGRAELESRLRIRLYDLAMEKGYGFEVHNRQINIINK